MLGLVRHNNAAPDVPLDEFYRLIDLVLDIPADITTIKYQRAFIPKRTCVDNGLRKHYLRLFGEEKTGGSGYFCFGLDQLKLIKNKPRIILL